MKQLKMNLGVAVGGLLVLVATSASAQSTILTEDFNYADGPLAVANSAWVNHSGTADTLFVASNEAQILMDGGSEDLHRVFDGGASFTSGVVTANFDIRVTAPGPISDNGDDEYFAHFWASSATTAFRARAFVHMPTAGGDYTLSISTASSSVSVDLPVDFSFDTIVPVSISFDLDAATASITAGGSTVTDFTAPPSVPEIDGFALRQSTDSNNLYTLYMDNLVVTHVPEPSTFALIGGLLALGITIVRRRRR